MKANSHSMNLWFDCITGLISLFHRLMLTGAQAFENSRFMFHTVGKLRRFCQVHFQKEYVQKQLLLRDGECHQCGTCCNFLFACPMLTKDRYCRIYGTCRPKACRIFPIDHRDIDEVKQCGGKCGYRFNS